MFVGSDQDEMPDTNGGISQGNVSLGPVSLSLIFQPEGEIAPKRVQNHIST